MAQLIKPGSVKIVTNNGELQVSITLDWNINLNSSGLQVTAQATSQPMIQPIPQPNESIIKDLPKNKVDSDDWMIPDFSSSPKLNFGKKE